MHIVTVAIARSCVCVCGHFLWCIKDARHTYQLRPPHLASCPWCQIKDRVCVSTNLLTFEDSRLEVGTAAGTVAVGNPVVVADIRPAAEDNRPAAEDIRPAAEDIRPAAEDNRLVAGQDTRSRPAAADDRPSGPVVEAQTSCRPVARACQRRCSGWHLAHRAGACAVPACTRTRSSTCNLQ